MALSTAPKPASTGPRRVLNVVVAGLSIVLLAPLFLIIAVLVKLSSPGPVLYTQKRVGLDRRRGRGGGPDRACRREADRGGRLFTIYKFRTMRVESGSRQVWATPRDPRITPVGRVLRATHLDELPQLFNVLKGDMNIVGPRPEQPEIFQELSRKVPRYRRRQRVRPGITGLAQVSRGYDRNVEDVRRKVVLDLAYIEHSSALRDAAIMARTLPRVLPGTLEDLPQAGEEERREEGREGAGPAEPDDPPGSPGPRVP